jgi:hypothetical protein
MGAGFTDEGLAALDAALAGQVYDISLDFRVKFFICSEFRSL